MTSAILTRQSVIREAVDADIQSLVDMGRRFLASTIYAELLAENPDQMIMTAARLISNPDGVVFIAEDSHGPVGMIGMIAYAHFMSGERTAGEVFWWVEPTHRGSLGLRLLKRAEQWARERGAIWLQMIAPTPDVGRIYERLGYRALETSYYRTL